MAPEGQSAQLAAPDYKSYVGPANRYDFMGASQFRLLTALGLRSHHKLLDFGCGSLRSGKLFIPYLDYGNYYGQDPNKWLLDEGIDKELGEDILKIKAPNFCFNGDFSVGFDVKFDFIVAQSIFSHTNFDCLKKGLEAIIKALDPDGIALVTVIEGKDYTGKEEWVYPKCTKFTPKTIASVLNALDCNWKRLYWFHPTQTWFAISKHRDRLPRPQESFLLLGGEEVQSDQYNHQTFAMNRLFSLAKSHKWLRFLLRIMT